MGQVRAEIASCKGTSEFGDLFFQLNKTFSNLAQVVKNFISPDKGA